MKKIILSLFLSIFLFSCKMENSTSNNLSKQNIDTISKKEVSVNSEQTDEAKIQSNKSFTIVCGSGCAMTYNEVSRENNSNFVEIKYTITQYINEKTQDEYSETYRFDIDNNGFLKKICLDKDNENILNDENSLIREKLLEIGNEFSKGLSENINSKNIKLVNESKPYNLITVPFDLKEYVKNLPEEIKNGYSPSSKLIDYLVSIDYEGENYKSYFLKMNDKSTDLIVLITRGDSEYFLLIKVIDNKFSSYKEIGSTGESTKYFKVDKNYNVVIYK